MLGVYSPREPITPEFSREIRAALRRAVTGQPNEKEKERFSSHDLFSACAKISLIFS